MDGPQGQTLPEKARQVVVSRKKDPNTVARRLGSRSSSATEYLGDLGHRPLIILDSSLSLKWMEVSLGPWISMSSCLDSLDRGFAKGPQL